MSKASRRLHEEDLELIRACLEKLPPFKDLRGTSSADQKEQLFKEEFHWRSISLSWEARITGSGDPLEEMQRSGEISPWGKTYFQLKTDYFWCLWLITQAVWSDAKKNLSPQIHTPGELFKSALKRASMKPIFQMIEPYREMSTSKRRKVAELLPKAINQDLPKASQNRLDHLLKHEQVGKVNFQGKTFDVDKYCSEGFDYILAIAINKSKFSRRESRLQGLIKSLDDAIARLCKHELNAPKADTKAQKMERSFAWRNGQKTYAMRGGNYERRS